MSKISTKELESIIKNSCDLKTAIDKYKDSMIERPPASVLKKVIAESGLTNSALLKNISLSKSYYYEILRGLKKPSRNAFLQILIGCNCKLEDTQAILNDCGYKCLYIRNQRDAVLIYAFSHGLSLIKTNILLDSFDLETLNK